MEVIGKYMPLTQKGREYVGVCPFHDDHDPSLRVSPDKQIYKCFVCGAGGNVFTFLQNYEHIGFLDAVSKVAAMNGIPFHHTSQKPRPVSPYQPLYQALQTFADYARYTLASKEGAMARSYLEDRKFTKEILDAFEIGYAPSAARAGSFLKAKKLDETILRDAGLIRPESGAAVFHDRVLIPIHDASGHPVGFTARILPGAPKEAPKYINTTQTPVYEKGHLVFNYHRAKEHVRKEGYAVLTEGAMDVLGLEKAGIHTGIAMLGTACTPAQLQLLRDLYVTIRVFYDNDTAGQNAVWKFGQAALKAGVPFVVVNNQAQKDPDEIFIDQGADALKATVSHTISFTEFAFDFLLKQYDLNNYEDKKAYGQTMADLIRRNSDVHEWSAWYDKLKERTGLDYSQDVPHPSQRSGTSPSNPPSSARTWNRASRSVRRSQPSSSRMNEGGPALDLSVPRLQEGRLHAEKWILAAMLKDQKYAQHFKGEIGYFKNPLCHRLSLYIYEAYRQHPQLDAARLFSDVQEDEIRALLSELTEIEHHLISDDLYWDSLSKIKEFVICDQIDECSRKLAMSADPQEKLKLTSRKVGLIRQRNELRQRKDVPQE